jgi:hypothetical protein
MGIVVIDAHGHEAWMRICIDWKAEDPTYRTTAVEPGILSAVIAG